VALFPLLQNIDTTLFWALYGLSHQSVFLDAVGIFFAEYAAYVFAALLAAALVWPYSAKASQGKPRVRAAVIVSVIAALIARYAVKAAIVFAYPRPRPFVGLSAVHPLINILPWENLQSFPSGHAIFFFAIAAALYYFNKKIGFWAFIIAALIGIARIYAGVHWPSDILGGAILGIATGWLVYRFYRNYSERVDKGIAFLFNKNIWCGVIIGILVLGFFYAVAFSNFFSTEYRSALADAAERFFPLPTLDTADYDARLLTLAHAATSTPTLLVGAPTPNVGASTTPRLWPVQKVYPNAGAILPFKRIVAYYGNFYSTQMGVLGEYPANQMLAMLASTTEMWAAADPATPTIPAIQYIAVVAQERAGKEKKHILRMPDDQIDYALGLANQIRGLLILDVQVGKSTLQAELPLLEKYLAMPQAHLAIDPEFSMKYGNPPGTVIGTFDAADINYAGGYLASIVNKYHLPPKILVVHRFTENMVTNYEKIQPLPEVEIIMDMDGFGTKELKYGTYNAVIYPEPVQFTGIKLFYKNDIKPPSTGILTPAEVLNLTPAPIYIQYQ